MKITINTTIKRAEMANFIIGQSIQSLFESESNREYLGITLNDVEEYEKFSTAFTKALLKAIEKS